VTVPIATIGFYGGTETLKLYCRLQSFIGGGMESKGYHSPFTPFLKIVRRWKEKPLLNRARASKNPKALAISKGELNATRK
jgi:hypothetical protein